MLGVSCRAFVVSCRVVSSTFSSCLDLSCSCLDFPLVLVFVFGLCFWICLISILFSSIGDEYCIATMSSSKASAGSYPEPYRNHNPNH